MPPKPPAAAAAGAKTKTKMTATKKKSETGSIDVCTPSPLPPPRGVGRTALTRPQDLALPRSLVTRLAKSVLPANAAIQKLALDALSQSATVFVNFVCVT